MKKFWKSSKESSWLLDFATLGKAKGINSTDSVTETKVKATKQLAEEHEFPLLVTMEPEPESH